MPSEVLKARAILATKSRPNVHASPADLDDARRELAVAKLAAYVQKVVEQAPPLTPDQRARISALLRTGGGAQ